MYRVKVQIISQINVILSAVPRKLTITLWPGAPSSINTSAYWRYNNSAVRSTSGIIQCVTRVTLKCDCCAVQSVAVTKCDVSVGQIPRRTNTYTKMEFLEINCLLIASFFLYQCILEVALLQLPYWSYTAHLGS